MATIGAGAAVAVIALGTWFGAAHLGKHSGDSDSSKAGADPSESPSMTIAQGPVPDLLAAGTTSYPSLSNADAIAAVLRGFPEGTFTDLELNPSDSKLNVENRLDMAATVSIQSSSEADVVRASWEGCLADGALAEYLVGDSDNLATAVQGRVTAERPDGSTEQASGCGGDIAAGQLFGAQADHSTDAEIIASVHQALADIDVTVDRVDVLRPLGPAVDVTITVPDSEAAADVNDQVNAALDAKPFPYEGVFIEVDGPDGSPLMASGTGLRSGTGNEWSSQ